MMISFKPTSCYYCVKKVPHLYKEHFYKDFQWPLEGGKLSIVKVVKTHNEDDDPDDEYHVDDTLLINNSFRWELTINGEEVWMIEETEIMGRLEHCDGEV